MSILQLSSVGRSISELARASTWIAAALTALVHLVALAILYHTEWGYLHAALALISWCLLNFLWLAILARPATAAVLSLAMLIALIAASLFKFAILWTGLSFFDFLIIDPDTVSYLLAIIPNARIAVLIGILAAIPLLIAVWRLDPFRIRRSLAALGAGACVVALGAISARAPMETWESFQGVNHTSNFFRSAATEVSELMTHGLLAADAQAGPPLPLTATAQACRPASKPPHIILLLDE